MEVKPSASTAALSSSMLAKAASAPDEPSHLAHLIAQADRNSNQTEALIDKISTTLNKLTGWETPPVSEAKANTEPPQEGALWTLRYSTAQQNKLLCELEDRIDQLNSIV